MIDANAQGLARKERDDAQDNLDWEEAKDYGAQEAMASINDLTAIIVLATQLDEKIRGLQRVSKTWDTILDGADINDLENSNTAREAQSWIEKYAEDYASMKF